MDFSKLINSYKEDIIKSTQEVIRIKSVEGDPKEGMPFGQGPYEALKYTLDLAEDMGFEIKNFENYAAHADLGNGEESVAVLVHVDVVPEGEGWKYPPYGGEIHDDKIYGRGTVDDKGPAIATLYAMKAIKESGVKLARKIRIILGANEESGWGCMNYYFKHEKAPTMGFTPDANFPAIHGEKGIIAFDLVYELKSDKDCNIKLIDIKGGTASNMVPDHSEVLLEVADVEELKASLDNFLELKGYPISLEVENDKNIRLISKGISAHGSTPEKGENAVSYLMEFLGTLFSGDCSFGEYLKIYNERIGFLHHGEKIGCDLEDDVSGKLNFNPGVIELVDNKIVLTINVRYPIKSSAQEVYEGIESNLKGTNIELIRDETDSRPLYVPKDNFLVKKLMDVYRKETGDHESQPITIGGGTYARAMDNAVAFGPVFPGQKDVVHQKNEYIAIDHLMKITKIYAQALYELAKEE